KKITLGKNKYPGREFTYVSNDRKYHSRDRLYLVGNRAYHIFVLGATSEFLTSKAADAFLASFKVEEPKASPKVVFTSKEGKYTMTFPEKPKEMTRKQKGPLGVLVYYFSYVEAGNDTGYMAAYADFPKGTVRASNKAKMLDGGRDKLLTTVKGKKVSEKQ